MSLDHSVEMSMLTSAEVAALFRVNTKTITRWTRAGKFTTYRTPGGHRRYDEAEVRALLNRGRGEH